MIFDRTEADVAEAKRIFLEKICKDIPLDDNEKNTLDKGYVTKDTIQRIEDKQAELYLLFTKYGYSCPVITTKKWEDKKALFRKSDFQRLIDNCDVLKKCFFSLSETPDVPFPLYGYKEFNSIEKILYDLDKNVAFMIENIYECGTFESGEI